MSHHLTTDRLILRCLQPEDAPDVARLAGDYDVYRMTLNIPHPYPEDIAIDFIRGSIEAWEQKTRFAFAITHRETGDFMGVIGVHPEIQHARAEIGYWIGKPFWNQGYMTEALQRIIQFAFDDLNLNRVQARYLTSNPASGHVMEKVGMHFEGVQRAFFIKDGQPVDLYAMAILRDDFQSTVKPDKPQGTIQPLETERLILRCLQMDDVPHIATLLNDYDIAKMTRSVPYPYPPARALAFVKVSIDAWHDNEDYTFAIVQKRQNKFMGYIELHPNLRNQRAEVGYWVGKAFWNQGYVTEALRCVIQFGFETLDLNRIDASYRIDNIASARVMEKVGMQHEGTFRQFSYRDGKFHDTGFRAILREDYYAQNP